MRKEFAMRQPELRVISERDKLRCLAEQWGCRFVDLDSCELVPDTVKLLSQEIARRWRLGAADPCSSGWARSR